MEYEKWKQFLENITVEWLISNYTKKYEYGDVEVTQPRTPDHISTRNYDWLAYCGSDVRYHFNTPSGLYQIGFGDDELLIGHLPMDVWDDFIRVIEL